MKSHLEIFLGLAAIGGFVWGGELGATPGAVLRILAGLFVIVFLATLAWTVLSDAIHQAETQAAETLEGAREAVFGNP